VKKIDTVILIFKVLEASLVVGVLTDKLRRVASRITS